MPSVPLFTNVLLLTSILSCSVAADEPTKSTPATPAQAPVADSSSDPQPLPDGIQRFNGMLVGRLLKRDVEKGSFVIAVDAVSRVWENSRAESPASLVGRRIEVSGVFGKFLDVLVVTRVGETLEFECRHDGDKLVFPGELLRKVAPYAPEDYPVLPEEFRGFRGIVQAEVLKKDPESLEMIIRVDRVLSSASGNAARNPPSIEGKNLLLAGFWNRREAFAGIKPGDKLEAGLQHISRRSDHVAVADPIRRTAVGPGARRMSEEEMRELQRPEQNSVGPASADNVPAGQRGFRGMLVGRLVSKDIERGTFSMQVEVVPRVWKNNQSADPRALRGKIVEAGGVSGKLLDVLLLCKTGETLEFGAKDDGGSRLTVIETLRKVGPDQPDFQKHIVPLLSRLGCSGRACHGSFQGRGGLRLSLFGYDFRTDHAAFTAAGDNGPRINRKTATDSLVLQKPLLRIPHEGGRRFESDSAAARILQRWIEQGARGTETPAVLKQLLVQPSEVVFDNSRQVTELTVTAVWENGTTEDVTAFSRFRTNDESVALVDDIGKVTSAGSGDTHVVVFYDNGVTAVPVLRAFPGTATSAESIDPVVDNIPSASAIDRLIEKRLQQLGITPALICGDTEFLRRASLDATGTLPTPNEIRSFLADVRPDRRQRKIDELLDRPAFAAWWANRICDWTGCNPAQQAELGQETSVQWAEWIRVRLQKNESWDRIVRGIVLATSRLPGQSWEDYTADVSACFRDGGNAVFASRPTMPHYWTRRSMQKPEDAAQAFAQNFLGIRLQCAQCHKHPFAPWSQQDFREFSRFFEPIKFGVPPDSQAAYRELANRTGLNVRDPSAGTPMTPEVLRQAQQGRSVPWRELFIKPRDSAMTLSLLQSGSVTLQPTQDPREVLMNWIGQPDNPWFARAFVNRVWASYFHRGLIDPPDDLNPANPPSNPALLQWLEQDFIQSGYDIRRLHCQILTSRTWQRSIWPGSGSPDDRRHFSRAIPRRMPAEIIYDALKQSLAATDQQQSVRTDLTRRAIGDLSMRLAGTYAMSVFGKPERAVNCDCERNNQPSLLQAVFLQNDPLVEQRLEESGWLQELAALEAAGMLPPAPQLIEESWLRTLSRLPSAEELARAQRHVQQASSVTESLRDLMWALINTKEYILVH